ncbi:MAG: transglycosylase SLT domain-containing protein [Pseudomonadota bacterium]
MRRPRTRRWAVAGVLVALLGSCASDPQQRVATAPPKQQDDVCAIFDQRPDWRVATVASAARWGAPVEVQMAIIWRESSFRATARPPQTYSFGIPTGRLSSAFGYSQAIDGTWAWYREESGNARADRTDFADAADFVGWYMAKTQSTNGLDMYDAYNQYLAYHEGHTGFRRGSWREKAWLQRAAGQVAYQAQRYREQLSTC